MYTMYLGHLHPVYPLSLFPTRPTAALLCGFQRTCSHLTQWVSLCFVYRSLFPSHTHGYPTEKGLPIPPQSLSAIKVLGDGYPSSYHGMPNLKACQHYQRHYTSWSQDVEKSVEIYGSVSSVAPRSQCPLCRRFLALTVFPPLISDVLYVLGGLLQISHLWPGSQCSPLIT